MEETEKKLFLKLVLLSVWSSFFLSINLNPQKFFEYNFINQIRLILPCILTIVLLAFKYKDIKISNFINIYSFLFYTIFFLYIFFNFTSLENSNVNIYWPLYMFLSFFTLHNFTNSNEKEIILKLTLIIVALGFIFYFSVSTFELLTRPEIHFYGVLDTNLSYIGLESPPRSSGLARLSLILYSFLMFYFIVHKKRGNYTILILLCFLATQCLLYHSRTVSFIYFTLNILIIVFYYKKFFENKKLIIFAIIIPLLANFFYNVNVISKRTNDQKEHQIYSKENLSIYGKDAFKNIFLRDSIGFKKNPERFSSDRFYNWEKAIKIIRKDFITGHGAQADRLLISNQSIHNSLLYVILSGSIFAGLALISIYVYSLIILIKFYLTKAYKTSKSSLIHFSASILIIINLRSILETSFAVFSIDYLIYIIAFLFLRTELKKYD